MVKPSDAHKSRVFPTLQTKLAKSETSDFVGGTPFKTRRAGRIWPDTIAVCLVRSTTTHFASRLGLEPNPPRQNGSI